MLVVGFLQQFVERYDTELRTELPVTRVGLNLGTLQGIVGHRKTSSLTGVPLVTTSLLPESNRNRNVTSPRRPSKGRGKSGWAMASFAPSELHPFADRVASRA